jgi:hypothetical protein
MKKTPDFYFFVFFYDFFSLKYDVNVSKVISKQQKTIKKIFFVGVLKVIDERSKIPSRIRIR